MATLRWPGVAWLDSVLKVFGCCLRPHTFTLSSGTAETTSP
jgi:hypothetical protein